MTGNRRVDAAKRCAVSAIVCAAAALSGCSKEPVAQRTPSQQLPEAVQAKRQSLTLPGLVAAYGFDEGSGTLAADATENTHDGTLDGQTWVTGKYGGALHFEENFVTIADSSLLDLTTASTVSAWVRPTADQPVWPTILMKELDGASGLSYSLYWEFWDTASFCAGAEEGWLGQCVHAQQWAEPGAVWTYVTGTFDGSDLRLYLNGVLMGEVEHDVPIFPGNGPLRIGGNGVWEDEWFIGDIDEVRIYDRALTAQEIAADMNSPIGGAGCSGPLDDGNPCTTDACTSGTITHTPVAAGTPCPNATVCDGDEQCDATGTCQPGTPPPIEDGNVCTLDSCDPVQGVIHANAPLGTPCMDADACNGDETCDNSGTCVAGTPVTCTAQDQCHDPGTCDPITAACSNPPKADGTTCNDGSACTQSDTCQAGTCSGADPVVCTAQDQCHDAGTCNPATGVCSNPAKADGATCNDDDACTQTDTCQSGACTGGNPVVCVAQSQCHDVGTCDPGTGTCSNPVKADGASCSDGDGCTQTDTCQSGTCTGANPVVCTAQSACHDAGTCDPGTGQCSNPAKEAGASCPNGDSCDGQETCDGSGACVAGTPPVIDDQNPCTADSCDPGSGVSHVPVAAGTTCGVATCSSAVATSAPACDGSGSCRAGTTTPCAPFVCGASACLTSCSDDSSCVAAAYCNDSSQCADQLGPNLSCTRDRQCSTGACVDGACCSSDVNADPLAGVALDPTQATDFVTAVQPLYAGATPSQAPVVPGAIDETRLSVVRGRVLDTAGAPLACVTVDVLNGEEFGSTRTRADGSYSIALNGGGPATIRFRRGGYVTAYRDVVTAWLQFAWAEDVRLQVPAEPTPVSATAATITAVAGTIEVDDQGMRQAQLLVPPGTHALVDGQVRDEYDVRVTEVTNLATAGRQGMPADLPANSAFTYAVNLAVEDTEGQTVTFDKPLAFYVENFLDFPVGEEVPVGYYDEVLGQWVASDNGRIIAIVGRNAAGEALLDINSTPGVDDPSSLGIDSAERIKLASMYPDGTSLWRFTTTHFSTWDANWGFGPPAGASAPKQPSPRPPGTPDPCRKENASTIECENGVLLESVPIAATDFSLVYSTARQPRGRKPLLIPVHGGAGSVPAIAKRIDLDVEIAGRQFSETFEVPSTGAPPLVHAFEWDGLDSSGRRLFGAQPIHTRIGYVYDGSYERTPRFGYNGNGTIIAGSKGRFEVSLLQEWSGTMENWDARGVGIGGWNVSVHHAYDPANHTVYLGDGTTQKVSDTAPTLVTLAGTGAPAGFSGDGGPANAASINLFGLFVNSSVAVANDGSVYFTDARNNRIRKVSPDGIISTVAGGGTATSPPYGDGGLATNATFDQPSALAFGPDGALYVADTYRHRIRVIQNGIISNFAGTGTAGYDGSGVATAKRLRKPTGLAVANDGTVYIADSENFIVRRVRDGFLDTIAGATPPAFGSSGDGGPATAARFGYLTGVAVSSDGSIYVSDYDHHRVRKISVGGIVTTYAGTGSTGSFPFGDGGPATSAQLFNPDGLAVGPDDLVYIVDKEHHSIRRVNAAGIIETVVGNSARGYSGEGLPATSSMLNLPRGMGIGPDGTIYVADTDNVRLRKTAAPIAVTSPTGELIVPSRDGRELFYFNQAGKHLKTVDAYTGITRYSFTYDAAGYLVEIADRDATDPARRITRIERNGSGQPTQIVAPDGQITQLSVDGANDLRTVTDPAGGLYSFDYYPGGLLQTFRDPKSNAEAGPFAAYTYDGWRLLDDTGPTGSSQTLDFFPLPAGSRTTRTTTLGRVTSYEVQYPSDVVEQRIITGPDGLTSVAFNRLDAKAAFAAPNGQGYSRQITHPDGRAIYERLQPDSLFGLEAPIAAERVTYAGSGAGAKVLTEASTRAVVRSSSDPNSVTQATETYSRNGRTFTSVFERSGSGFINRTTLTSAAGRVTITELDARGRLSRLARDDFYDTRFSYDGSDRPVFVAQGADPSCFDPGAPYPLDCRRSSKSYYSSGAIKGYLQTETDALGRTTSYVPDALGRVMQQILPAEPENTPRVLGMSWDANGNMTSLTPPGRAAHSQLFDSVNQLTQYTPPEIAGTQTNWHYDLDRFLQQIDYSGTTGSVVYTYETSPNTGRLDSIAFSGDLLNYDYHPTTGLLSTIAGPAGQSVAFGYTGSLLTSSTLSGTVNTTVTRDHDNDFRVTSLQVGTRPAVTFTYDPDGLLASAGPLALDRDIHCDGSAAPKNGLLRRTRINGFVDTCLAYNGFGEPETTSVQDGSGTDLFDVTYIRDQLGRIVQKTESIREINGTLTTRVFDYTYTAEGFLESVAEDAVMVGEYQYDGNGNRLGAATGASTVTPSEVVYDGQDRLLRYGETLFGYTPNGELAARCQRDPAQGTPTCLPNTTTSYVYDAMGALRSVARPGQPLIEYVINAEHRRIGKLVGGTLVQAFVYDQGALLPIAELDGAGNVVAEFVYGEQSHSPSVVFWGGNVYRIVSDHLGSPRLVYNVASPYEIVLRRDYDEYGNVILDQLGGAWATAGYRLPFGFAGGLYDPDTELTRFGARDYDPAVGRWVSKDPIRFGGGQPNVYVYVGNNPTNRLDPLGLATAEDCSFVIGLSGIVDCAIVCAFVGGPAASIVCSVVCGLGFMGADHYLCRPERFPPPPPKPPAPDGGECIDPPSRPCPAGTSCDPYDF